jgi:hypothetical protein
MYVFNNWFHWCPTSWVLFILKWINTFLANILIFLFGKYIHIMTLMFWIYYQSH